MVHYRPLVLPTEPSLGPFVGCYIFRKNHIHYCYTFSFGMNSCDGRFELCLVRRYVTLAMIESDVFGCRDTEA